jgi:hypothetical protein
VSYIRWNVDNDMTTGSSASYVGNYHLSVAAVCHVMEGLPSSL